MKNKKAIIKTIENIFIYRQFFMFFILLSSILLSNNVFAQTNQKTTNNATQIAKNEPINVDADNQKIDLNNDTLLFTGDVIATQGSLNIKSDTLLINNMSNNKNQIITAKGNPVYLEQQIEGKKGLELVKGKGNQLVYNVEDGLLTLTGDAIVYKIDGTVKGNVITYNLNTDVIQAFSGEGQRVNTVLQPSTNK